MRANLSWLLLLVLTGCAGRLENRVRREAAEDLSCSESDITVKRVSPGAGTSGTYSAAGCGASSNYVAECRLFCGAKSEQQMAEQDAQYAADNEARAKRESEGGGQPPASSTNFASTRLTNLCGEKVLLWRGDKPNGSGRSDSLGANTTISVQGSNGDKVWIVDSSSDTQGVSSFPLEPELKQLYIDKSCRSFTTKR